MRIVTELEPSPKIYFYNGKCVSLSSRLFGGKTTTIQSKLYSSLILLDNVIERLHAAGVKTLVEIDSRFVSERLHVGKRFVRQFFMILLASCLAESVCEIEEGRRTIYRIETRIRIPWEEGLDPLVRASSILRSLVLAYDAPRSILLAFLAGAKYTPRIEEINSFYSVLARHIDRLHRYIPCAIVPCSESRIEPITLRSTKDGVLLSAYAITDLAIPLLMMAIAGLALPAKEPPYLRTFAHCKTKSCRKLLARLWGLETPTKWLFEFYEHLSSLDIDSALRVIEEKAGNNPVTRLTLSIARYR